MRLPEFVATFLLERFGVRAVALQAAVDLLFGLETLRPSFPEVEHFSLLLRELHDMGALGSRFASWGASTSRRQTQASSAKFETSVAARGGCVAPSRSPDGGGTSVAHAKRRHRRGVLVAGGRVAWGLSCENCRNR
ncbi:unnamed protein product [Ectocarpus sp. 12 AP-2014]